MLPVLYTIIFLAGIGSVICFIGHVLSEASHAYANCHGARCAVHQFNLNG